MQATTRFHDGITNPVLQESDGVLHHPLTFHPTNGVLNADSNRRDATIDRVFRWGEFTPPGLFLRLDHGDPSPNDSLASPILLEITSRRPGVTGQSRQDLLLDLPVIGVTPEANRTRLIDHEEVVDRVAFLRTTVICLLVLGIFRPVDRSLSTIMPNRGDVGLSCV